MKSFIFSATIVSAIIFSSCGNSSKQEAEIQQAKQQTLDSIAEVQTASRIKQLRQDSLKNAQELEQRNVASNHHSNGNVNTNTASSEPQTAEQKKKGMSNTTKGALIGTGAGIITGAAVGAATSQDKGKGAIIGGIIGGAAGSGAGYGTGAVLDKNKKKEAEKN